MTSIKILFEDDDILALYKPAGVAVHGDGRSKNKNLVDWLVKKYPKIKNVGEPTTLDSGETVDRDGIVHRLDKDTSGVLLVAKTDAGFYHLKSQFKNREIKKTYHAFVYGKFRDERGMIDKPIGREAGGVRRWATGARARGEMRDALTRYKVLKTGNGRGFVEVLGSPSPGRGALQKSSPVSLLEVWPLTGRTHQIRVHMNSIGHPVVADTLYAPRQKPLLGFKRQALHASKVTFKDLKGKSVEIKAPFPEDFEKAMEEISSQT
ncbi:MAG TPA: RluA family pseudouridine synthase [Candidatus Paceibacterota bacterium]